PEVVEGLAHCFEADELSFAPVLDQSRVGEDLQVVRHGGLGHVEGARALPAKELTAAGHRPEDAQPGSVGERFGDAYELLVVHSDGAPAARTGGAGRLL